mmetsp:Transcript_6827/g.11347  ORF Transcript_6827/g.11347 Transcript_6827/m.11347 type:complete len:372 (-) Transcript_6827:988-2103(-)
MRELPAGGTSLHNGARSPGLSCSCPTPDSTSSLAGPGGASLTHCSSTLSRTSSTYMPLLVPAGINKPSTLPLPPHVTNSTSSTTAQSSGTGGGASTCFSSSSWSSTLSSTLSLMPMLVTSSGTGSGTNTAVMSCVLPLFPATSTSDFTSPPKPSPFPTRNTMLTTLSGDFSVSDEPSVVSVLTFSTTSVLGGAGSQAAAMPSSKGPSTFILPVPSTDSSTLPVMLLLSSPVEACKVTAIECHIVESNAQLSAQRLNTVLVCVYCGSSISFSSVSTSCLFSATESSSSFSVGVTSTSTSSHNRSSHKHSVHGCSGGVSTSTLSSMSSSLVTSSPSGWETTTSLPGLSRTNSSRLLPSSPSTLLHKLKMGTSS